MCTLHTCCGSYRFSQRTVAACPSAAMRTIRAPTDFLANESRSHVAASGFPPMELQARLRSTVAKYKESSVKLGSRRAIAIISLSLIASRGVAAKAPVEWDGLRKLASKRMDVVYLQPGADFRLYSRVMVDPTEVSF